MVHKPFSLCQADRKPLISLITRDLFLSLSILSASLILSNPALSHLLSNCAHHDTLQIKFTFIFVGKNHWFLVIHAKLYFMVIHNFAFNPHYFLLRWITFRREYIDSPFLNQVLLFINFYSSYFIGRFSFQIDIMPSKVSISTSLIVYD